MHAANITLASETMPNAFGMYASKLAGCCQNSWLWQCPAVKRGK